MKSTYLRLFPPHKAHYFTCINTCHGKSMASNVVFVAGGQCGNQLGYTLLSNISAHLESDISLSRESDVFFRGQKTRRARCVCLDTEPKAGMYLFFYLVSQFSCNLSDWPTFFCLGISPSLLFRTFLLLPLQSCKY